jgi:hypothetical protein
VRERERERERTKERRERRRGRDKFLSAPSELIEGIGNRKLGE